MKPAECRKIMSGYLALLRSFISVNELKEGTCVISTPFLDRKNDCLQVVAEREGGMVHLHDAEEILSELKLLGIDFKSPYQARSLRHILNGLGVSSEGLRLFVKVPEEKAAQGLHSLTQAMLKVDDLHVWNAQRRRRSYFDDDVSSFLKSNSVRFCQCVKLKGKSGFEHVVDYLVQDSAAAPERIVKAINSPNKSSVSRYLFALEDIRKARGGDVRILAVLNDSRREVKGEIIEALEEYQVRPVLWSERMRLVKQLSA